MSWVLRYCGVEFIERKRGVRLRLLGLPDRSIWIPRFGLFQTTTAF